MEFAKVLQKIKDDMLSDFEFLSGEVQHDPAKGRMREAKLIRDFLRPYMPRDVGVGNGEVISIDGSVSGEMDIVFYNNALPPLVQVGDYSVFPAEMVYGVMEVKSYLDSLVLAKVWDNLGMVKRMPKTAYLEWPSPVKPRLNLYGCQWSEFFPTVSFVFAYKSVSLETLKDMYEKLSKETDCKHRIDSIWVLDKGYVANGPIDQPITDLAPNPETVVRCVRSDNCLVPLVVQLQALMQAAWSRPFAVNQYLPGVWGEVVS